MEARTAKDAHPTATPGSPPTHLWTRPSPEPPTPAASGLAAQSPARPSCDKLTSQAINHAKALIAAELSRATAANEPNAQGLSSAPPAFVGQCFPAPDGAWLTAVQSATFAVGYGGQLDLLWVVEYVDASGQRAVVVPSAWDDESKPGVMNYTTGPDAYEIVLRPFDYDGDAVPELFVGIQGRFHEGESFAVGKIYTVKSDRIERYAPSKAIAFEDTRDVDGDGRPDLVLRAPFSTVCKAHQKSEPCPENACLDRVLLDAWAALDPPLVLR